MLVDADRDVDVPVLLMIVGATLDVVEATLLRLSAETMHLRTSATPAINARVIVTLERSKLLGTVRDLQPDGCLVIARDGAHAPDDRAAPRVRGRLGARWRELRDGAPAGHFEGVTEISVSGMLLPSCRCPVGARLELELDLGAEATIRMVAVVRRQGEGLAAVEFAQLSDEAADGLADFTIAHL